MIKIRITAFRLGYFLLIILRIISAYSLRFFPISGWLFSVFFDAIDYAYALRGHIKFSPYNYIDKTSDIIFRIFMVLAAINLDWEFTWIFIVLFILRLIGDVLFFILRNEIVFVFYPNILELFFIGFAFQQRYELLKFNQNINILIIFIVSTIIKIIHEYLGHFKKVIDPFSKNYLEKHPELGRKP